MRNDLIAIVEKWQRRADPNFADPEAVDVTLEYWYGVKAVCAELSAALTAQGETAPQIACPACGVVVQQVASATLNLALWQHWNWTCVKRAQGETASAREGWIDDPSGVLPPEWGETVPAPVDEQWPVDQLPGLLPDAAASPVPAAEGLKRSLFDVDLEVYERGNTGECAGPFSNAFDCPVHDPRKRQPAPVADNVDLLAKALEHAYVGSAEHGSFVRGTRSEWVPCVFMTLNNLRKDLAALRAVAEGRP